MKTSTLLAIAYGLQLIGFVTVGLCLATGLIQGDYGQLELVQLIAGSALFYLGSYLRGK